MWTKKTCFELGTRVPLIIAAPHITASHGKQTFAIAELVDVSSNSLIWTYRNALYKSVKAARPFKNDQFVALLLHDTKVEAQGAGPGIAVP